MATDTEDYTDDRLYRSLIKKTTELLEADGEVDTKVLEVAGRLVKDASIKPLNLSELDPNDPAAKRAAKLAAEKKKP